VVTVTGGSNKRVSLAALIAVKPGHRPRLIYRVHQNRRRGKDQRKGFTETEYARLLDGAHQQLGGPLVVIWDNLNTHVSAAPIRDSRRRPQGSGLWAAMDGLSGNTDAGPGGTARHRCAQAAGDGSRGQILSASTDSGCASRLLTCR
jgi:hypothetical protein